jgi:hypothetical protein
VNAHSTDSTAGGDKPFTTEKVSATPLVSSGQIIDSNDSELQRASDLVELHYGLKVKYLEKGLDTDLQKARDDVKRVYELMLHRRTKE